MKSWKRFVNIHTILLLIVLLTIGVVVWRFKTWGVKVDLEEIFKDGTTGEYASNLDFMSPVTDSDGQMVEDTDDTTTILFLGNSPFADDRDSEDGLVNLIAADSGATVYNCSVGDSYLSAINYVYDANDTPIDAYSFYWIAAYLALDSFDGYFSAAEEAMGDNCPQDAIEMAEMLRSVDMNTVDVIAIMYDATDYLDARAMGDQDTNSIQTYIGALSAGCQLLQETYPRIRIIVMGPPYAYAVDENGNYVSSDIYSYRDETILSEYSIGICAACVDRSITFVDNLYGTITEDNADQYLTDNLHVNVEGRRLLADRFLAALNYYD